jgi:tetratricopeptide (TPR) repeat protein
MLKRNAIKNLSLLCLAILAFALPKTAYSQADLIVINGLVKDEKTNKLLAGVAVSKVQNGELVETVTTGVNGRFIMNLEFDNNYDIKFSKSGYIAKFINIDATAVPDENKVGGIGFDLNMNLFEEVEGVNFDILKQPVGKAKYDAESGDIAFDYEYTRSMLSKIAALRRALEKKYKEEEEKLLADQKAAEAEAKKQAKFDALVQEGDGLMTSANYMNAIFKYSEALDLIPDVASVIQKLEKAKKALEDKQAEDELTEKYQNLIVEADKFFLNADYSGAKAKYTEASNLKPEENYPKTRLAEIDKLLGELANKEAIEQSYKDAVAAGDAAFKTQKFEESIVNYKKALEIKKNEKYPADQIKLAEKNIADLAADKEKEANYNKAIAAGDSDFSSGKYKDAITNYNEALGIKPTEAYPKEKIAEANKAIADAEAKNALDKQYNDAIAEADKAFDSEKWNAAVSGYTKALGLKQDQYPKDQITKANAKLAEIAANKEADENYSAAIAAADKLFGEKQYESAIGKYEFALNIKPNEDYPKDQISKAKAELKTLADANALNKKYNDLISKADGEFGKKEFKTAIATYNEALAVKSKEAYPKEQIGKAETELKKLASEAEKRKAYDAKVAEADASFGSKSYTAAIKEYNQALELYPNEAYPKEKIAEANKALGDISKAEQDQKKYAAEIKIADGLLKKKNYKDAITSYQKASDILPDESYPKEKMNEAQLALNALADQAELNKNYDAKISAADALFEQSKWLEAKTMYQEASGLKPMEDYPVNQISKADAKLKAEAEANAKEEEYNNLIVSADDLFKAEKFEESISRYNDALQIKPKDAYPKEQIAKAQKGIKASSDAAELKQKYDAAITEGDAYFGQKDYVSALAAYENAKALIPEEPLAGEKIEATNKKIAEQKELADKQKKYQELIAKADLSFKASKWQESIVDYKSALVVLPTETYPKDQISKAEANIAKAESDKQKVEEAYTAAIKYADEQFGKEEYLGAITAYENSLNYKPQAVYPKDQIEEANKRLAAIEAAEAKRKAEELLAQSTEVPKEEKKETKVVSFTDITSFGDSDEIKEKAQEEARSGQVEAKPDENLPKVPITTTPPEDLDGYRKMLGKNYPEGITKETIKEGNKTFYRTVIVKNKLGDEYLKVDARFGVFFFKNGLTIKASEFNAGVPK